MSNKGGNSPIFDKYLKLLRKINAETNLFLRNIQRENRCCRQCFLLLLFFCSKRKVIHLKNNL